MTVTVTVTGNADSYHANKFAVDLGYFWARTFFEAIDLNISPEGGMVGDWPIHDFQRRCQSYYGVHQSYADRIVKLCNDGICEGATRVQWA